jgi:hypothetical protein
MDASSSAQIHRNPDGSWVRVGVRMRPVPLHNSAWMEKIHQDLIKHGGPYAGRARLIGDMAGGH